MILSREFHRYLEFKDCWEGHSYAFAHLQVPRGLLLIAATYEGWNFNSGNYLFTTDTK